METVPPDNPPTVPDTEPTVATAVLLLVHIPLPPVPPPAGSLNAVVAPAHRVVTPLIAGGSAFTVTIVEIKQPGSSEPVEPIEYTMEAVPTVTPPTTPAEPIVATAVLPLLQLPPPASISVLVDPGQIWITPVIFGGLVLIVIADVAAQPSGSV